MSRAHTGLLLVALFLWVCDHPGVSGQGSAEPIPPGDAEFTGLPPQPSTPRTLAPRRAILVKLPAVKSSSTPTRVAATATLHAPIKSPPLSTQHAPEQPATSLALPPSPAQPEPIVTAPSVATPPPAVSPPDSSSPSTTASESPVPPAPAPSAAPSDTTPPTDGPTNVPGLNQAKVVVIETSLGRIVISLDDFAAPKTCKNFRQLIQDGFYNNTVFHRVIPNFIIQGGDPQSKSSATKRDTYGLGGPGYTIPPEIELKHDRGAVAMARLPDSVNPGRDSNGSQFYICLVPAPSLDDQYTVFGHVIQGMDVADKIAEAPRDKRDNPLSRLEMIVKLEPKNQLTSAGSDSNP